MEGWGGRESWRSGREGHEEERHVAVRGEKKRGHRGERSERRTWPRSLALTWMISPSPRLLDACT